MSRLLIPGLAWLVLLTGLALTIFAPELANDLMLALMGFAALQLFFVPGKARFWRHPSASMPLVAGLLLLLAFLITAQSPLHVAAVLVFIHLFTVAPLAGLLSRLARHLTLERIAAIAMTGVLGGAAVAVTDVYVFGAERAGLVNNPIHLADISLMIGFVALVGLWGKSRLRWLFLLGPVLALVTVMLTESRGALLAAIAMAGVAAIVLALSIFSRRLVFRVVGALAGVFLLGGVALVAYAAMRGGWPSDSLVVDESTSQRMLMYEAAAKAFLASPLAGHGLLDYYAAARAQMPAGIDFPDYAHLHNDLADFAAAGGILGIAAYALFLLAPLAGAARVTGKLRLPLLYLGGVTSTGYFAMGMTNAMLGLRWQDIVLATILAIIVVLSNRDEEPSI